MTGDIVELRRDGQPHYDRPVYALPRKTALAVANALNGQGFRTDILLGHERVRLRWMKPDGKGGLVPR